MYTGVAIGSATFHLLVHSLSCDYIPLLSAALSDYYQYNHYLRYTVNFKHTMLMCKITIQSLLKLITETTVASMTETAASDKEQYLQI